VEGAFSEVQGNSAKFAFQVFSEVGIRSPLTGMMPALHVLGERRL
jgi:hypothetical protein